MDWNISYREEDGIVLIKIINPINTLEQMEQISNDSASVGNYNQSQKYFIDHRGVTFGLSTLEIDEIPRLFKKAGGNLESKIAFLMDPASPNDNQFKFASDVLTIASIKFKLFTEENDAFAWLKTD